MFGTQIHFPDEIADQIQANIAEYDNKFGDIFRRQNL